MKPLPRSFYSRNTVTVARELLGKYLLRRIGRKVLVGKIVETEAYFEDDPASHSFRGKTPRCAPMFEEPGHAYVYFIYGNHYCLNVVTEKHGTAGAVLIRAIEPVKGIDVMFKLRGKPKGEMEKKIFDLTNGPGKLTQAFKIDRTHNRADLTKGDPVIMKGGHEKIPIARSGRIGISQASDKLYRFYIKGNSFVSG